MLTISLSGGSGSGKTTLAKEIMARFPVGFTTLLPMDAYYKDHSYLSDEEKKKHNFDHPNTMDFSLLNDHLYLLKTGIPIERPVYSFLSCSRQHYTLPVYPSRVIMLEGFMALINKKLRNNTDIRFYVDVTEENRLRRIIERDMKERGRTAEMVETRFYKTVKPMHEKYIEPYKRFADIIIDGNDTNVQTIVSNMEKIINEKLATINC